MSTQVVRGKERPPRWRLYLQLARVSNLPTVWTNALAGIVLVGRQPENLPFLFLMAAVSLFYAGGMFLNDAFDRDWDEKFRPERPIPAGHIRTKEVFALGFLLLFAAQVLLALARIVQSGKLASEPLIWGAILAVFVVHYNHRHKTDPLSPLVMALCRALLYFISAAAFATARSAEVLKGAAILAVYVLGLTLVARQENLSRIRNRWPLAFLAAPFLYTFSVLGRWDIYSLLYLLFLAWMAHALSLLLKRGRANVPRAVLCLIAGISLLDGVLIGNVTAQPLWGGLAVLGFVLTLLLHRYVPGT